MGYKIKKGILYLLLILLAAACMFPFWMMIVNATRSGNEIVTGFTMIPSTHLKENWEQVFKYFNLFKGMLNSLLVAIPATLLCAYFSTMTAYGLAFYKFKGNKIVFGAILAFMMIPGQLSLIGFYQLCTKMHLVNSYIIFLPQDRDSDPVTGSSHYGYHVIYRELEQLPASHDHYQ